MVHESTDGYGCHKSALDLLEPELQASVGQSMWMLGCERGPSARAVHTSNYGAISPAPSQA